MRRYELVATMTLEGMTWVVPASEGRHYRRGRLRARLTARRWTERDHHAPDPLPPFVWHCRRAA